MNSLHEIIDTIDQQLAHGQENLPSAGTVDPFAADHVQLKKYILVGTGSDDLAIPIEDLAEVSPLPVITRLPNLPGWILGIINLREEIISVVDLHGLFFENKTSGSNRGHLAVLKTPRMKLGICLDHVIGSASHPDSDLTPAADTVLSKAAPSVFNNLLKSHERSFHVLDADRLFQLHKLMHYNEYE